MVLTQVFFRRVGLFMVPREAQVLEQTVARAQTVLKQAHRRGVELEGISEVRLLMNQYLSIKESIHSN